MVINRIQRRYYALTFFMLYFFWDRLFEGLFSIPWMGVVRPAVILLLWMNVLLNWKHIKLSIENHKQLLKWFYFIVFMAFLSFLRSVYVGVPVGAVAYIYFQQFGFLPIAVLLASFSSDPINARKILRVIMISTVLLTVGVIWDAWIGFGSLISSDLGNTITRVGVQGIKRGDFTIGSTNVFVSLSVGVIATYYLSKKMNYGISKAFFVLGFIAIGMYASGSRAAFGLGVLLICFVILGLLKTRRTFLNGIFFLVLICSATILLSTMGIVNLDDEKLARYDNLFSEQNEGNFDRYLAWANGFNMMSDPTNVLGNGVGATNPQAAELFKMPISEGHFESSFFARYFEGGVIGLLTFLLPLLWSFKIYRKGGVLIIFVGMLLVFLNFAISPTAVGYQSNLVIFIILGISLMLADNKPRPDQALRH